MPLFKIKSQRQDKQGFFAARGTDERPINSSALGETWLSIYNAISSTCTAVLNDKTGRDCLSAILDRQSPGAIRHP
jgi:hypothetical protein